jgi:phospholipase C
VQPGAGAGEYFNAVAYSRGWYDFTVTASNETTWSQRFTGHLETGQAGVSG